MILYYSILHIIHNAILTAVRTTHRVVSLCKQYTLTAAVVLSLIYYTCYMNDADRQYE